MIPFRKLNSVKIFPMDRVKIEHYQTLVVSGSRDIDSPKRLVHLVDGTPGAGQLTLTRGVQGLSV
jgi:hypothetical protein